MSEALQYICMTQKTVLFLLIWIGSVCLERKYVNITWNLVFALVYASVLPFAKKNYTAVFDEKFAFARTPNCSNTDSKVAAQSRGEIKLNFKALKFKHIQRRIRTINCKAAAGSRARMNGDMTQNCHSTTIKTWRKDDYCSFVGGCAEKIYAQELRKNARGDRTALNNLTGQVTQCHFSKSWAHFGLYYTQCCA